MTFEERLRRVFDTAMAELTEAARAERDQARQSGVEEGHTAGLDEGRTQGRAEGTEEGRAQGWEDGREQGRFEGRQEAEQEHAAALAAVAALTPAAAPDAPASEQLLDAVRSLDRARSLSEILDTLASCAAREAARAAVFLVRGSQLRGWRFVGFDQSFSDAASIELAAGDAGVVGVAIDRGAPESSGAAAPFAGGSDSDSFAMPIAIAGETVAALYADGSPHAGARTPGTPALEILCRHAAQALEAMVALKAARVLTEPADVAGRAASASDADDDASARRYAKLLVSEIKLYHEPAVVAGRRDRDLATRLGGEIARARVLYEQRVPDAVRQRADYFHDELVRTLANGDATLLQLT
jgi:hypothetical protein